MRHGIVYLTLGYNWSIANVVNTPVKAYGELPEHAKINETDTFGEEDGECTFEFGDEGDVDIDEI